MDRRNKPGSGIAFAVTVIIMLSVLFFGSVEVWSTTLAEAAVFTLFLVWLIGGDSSADFRQAEGVKLEIYMLLALCGFLFYIIIQMIPLPTYVLKYLSPKSFELYSFYAVDKDHQAYISLYPYKTQVEFFRIVMYSLFFILIGFGIKDTHTIEKMIKILSYFGFGLAFFAILQKATWEGKLYWLREITDASPFGPFVNRNHYAGFIGMLIPLTLGVAFMRKSREKQILFGFFSLIMAVSLFLSLSRAGIISFLAGIAVFSLLLSWDKFRAKKRWTLAAFVFILFLFLLYLGIDPVIDRFYRTDMTHEARLAVWKETFYAFKDFFVAGSGLGTFINVFPLYSSEADTFIYDHAHNDYLEFILEMGIVGAIILLIFLFFLFRCIFRGKQEGMAGAIRISILASVTTIAVHSVFDFNLHIPSNALMLSAIFGIAFANSRIGRKALQDRQQS